jgi:GNAT superfamily N-acetyltransferase
MSNYRLRHATPEDFDALLPMAQKFFQMTNMSKRCELDVASAVEFYIRMLSEGFVLVAEEGGVPCALIGCIIAPFHLNRNHLMCTEALWWVEPEYRGLRISSDLEKAARRLAEERGCAWVTMSSLSTSPPVVGEYYEAEGYALSEQSFLKEL